MNTPGGGEVVDIREYLETCGTTTVRRSVGNPSVRPLAEIPPLEIDAEVRRLLELLEQHDISVDLQDCSPAEAYRYLTTEVMSAEIEDPRAPGWGIVFVHNWSHASCCGSGYTTS